MFPTNSCANGLPRHLDGVGSGSRAGEGFNGSEHAGLIERSIAYMAQHLNQPVRVAELAAQERVSPSYFFALFKRQTGSAPIDYFTHLRMQQACRLLNETFASVKEVAADVGYEDPFYFSRVFKSVLGVPPSRFRSARLLHDGKNVDTAAPPTAATNEDLTPVQT